jgi:pimeloyl-ACP methyl ester carboxylesterase
MTRRFVLLHGLAGSPQMWRPVQDLLAVHGPVSVPRLPWHGSAEPGWAWDPEPGAGLGALYTPQDVVVAHSFSASLLLADVFSRPAARPAALVLVSPFYRPRPADFSWSTMTHFMDGFGWMLASGIRTASSRRIAEEILTDMSLAVRERIGPYGWIRFFDSYLATAMLPVTGLPLPTAIVHGDDDDVAPPSDAAELELKMPGSQRFPVARGGHFPMLLDPAAVADAVLAMDSAAFQHTTTTQEVPA